jgi:RimJ/RimL family protein N-acetyltransferase
MLRSSLVVQAPSLETERLILRGPAREDFAAVAAIWADEQVTRFVLRAPLSGEEAWMRFLRGIGHWLLCGYGLWYLEEKSTGTLIGEVGFLDAHRDMLPSLEGTPEVGWVLARSAWGKGYASEALRSLLSWGDERLSASRFACMITPDNHASLRVAAKAGFREGARTSHRGTPVLLLYRARARLSAD